MKHAELFSGYGGLSLAVEAIFGAELAWCAEFDPAPSRIMARHWPGVPNYGDATSIDWSAVEPVDIISGGSPCQDVSAAGRRAGMNEGTRSNLWVAMREAIAAIKPTYVIWENVRGAHSASAYSEVESEPGLLGDTRDTYLRATGRVLGDLAGLGYDAEWRTVSAASVGAPHRRERVFLLAWRRDTAVADGNGRRVGWGDDAPREGDGGGAQSAPSLTSGQPGSTGPVSSVNLLPELQKENKNASPAKSRPGQNLPGVRSPANPEEVQERKTGGPNSVPGAPSLLTEVCEHQGDHHSVRTSVQGEAVSEGRLRKVRSHSQAPRSPQGSELEKRQPGESPDTVCELSPETALGRRSGGAHSGDPEIEWGPYGPAIRRWESVLGREAPPPTEPSPRGKQRLSAAFCEFMMGLPEGWICDTPGITRRDAIKAAGNGCVPQQATAALRDMIDHIPQEAA